MGLEAESREEEEMEGGLGVQLSSYQASWFCAKRHHSEQLVCNESYEKRDVRELGSGYWQM